LRLLDPDRFFDYQQFIEEEAHYVEVADAANALVAGDTLTKNQQERLTALLTTSDISALLKRINDVSAGEQAAKEASGQLLKQLLDRHGTGRILFRNSRNTITGFPQRQLLPAPLTMPAQYQQTINDYLRSDNAENIAQQGQSQFIFCPEMLYDLVNQGATNQAPTLTATWTDFDPRVDYLIDLLKTLRQEKLLVICAHAPTAIALEKVLRVKEGIRAAVFHQGLSIFERDKAAAYFAQDEHSAQVLLCSEIGSEGRNFQFAHHLMLFDLPSNPDLLEQRIGRLDRIGQTKRIALHVPYFEDSAQQLLFNWYQQGLNAFEQTCVTGRFIFDLFGQAIVKLALSAQWQSVAAKALIDESHDKHLALKAELAAGRDKLLELNSSGQGRAHQLVEQIAQQDRQFTLPQFMFQVFDVFGVQQDDKADNAIALNPTEHMLNAHFPCLPDDGTTITFDRATALQNEHYQLLTWDHPMVRGVIELLLSDDIGNASIGILKNPSLPVGTFFLECLFTIEATAPPQLQLGRYLPTTPLRVLVDKSGLNLAEKVSEKVLDQQLTPVKKQVAGQLVKALKTQVPAMVEQAQAHAEKQVAAIQTKALANMHHTLDQEFERLTALAAINPSVRQEELDFIKRQQNELSHYIAKAQLKFEAVRMIVVSNQ
jgi:ATP-dependent helicase HepA